MEEADVLTAYGREVRDLDFSPFEPALLASVFPAGVELWDVNTSQLRRTLTDAPIRGVLLSVEFSPDGTYLAASTSSGLYGTRYDDAVYVWQTSTWQPEVTYAYPAKVWPNSVAFAPTDATLLASSEQDGDVRLWRMGYAAPWRTFSGPGSSSYMPSKPSLLAFSPDRSLLAVGRDDGTVNIWQVPDGHLLVTLSAHAAPVRSLAFSPDGTLLATGSEDGTVKLWYARGD
jgi:WD40 repeat protein